MKVFVVLCLASLALASPQGYGFSGSSSGSYSAPTVVSERTYTIKPQIQQAEASYGGAYGGASLGAASFGGASFGGASYENAASAYGSNAGYGRSLGYSGAASSGPVHVEQRTYQLQAVAAPVPAPAASYEASGYYSSGAALSGAADQAATYTVNFGVNSGRSLDLSSGYAAGYNGYSGASQAASAYSGEASYGGQAEQIDLSAHPQGETKIFKHVYAFAGPEEPAQRAKVVVKAPVSNNKHFKLVFIKAPTSGAVVDSDITLPAQEEEKTQIYILSKQQQHQPTIRVHTAQAAKHNKPEVLFVKYKNEAEAQAIASGAISGQYSGIPAGGQLVSDGSVTSGGVSGGYGSAGYSGYSGASYGSGVGLGAATGRSLYASNSGNSGYGSGSTSFSFGTGSGSGFGSGFGSGSRSGYSSRSSFSGSY